MVRLSSTSALVLLWTEQECYHTKRAVEYLKQLDLEDGRVLYDWCNEGFRYAEVIKNRKSGIMHLIRQGMANSGNDRQIVIAGAGFDALGIELVELYPGTNVFEFDRDNMSTKSAMVARMTDGLDRRIFFIEVDLRDTARVRDELSAHGWCRLAPTLLVLEGISYYLPTRSIQALVDMVRPESVILEFLKQDKDIAIDRRPIPRRVFGAIAEMCGLPHIRRFDRMQVESLFTRMSIECGYSMMQMEKLRTGSNTLFPTENSGWIDVCLLRARQKDKCSVLRHCISKEALSAARKPRN
jgi:hypothetical protein